MTLSKFINLLQSYEKKYGDCQVATAGQEEKLGMLYMVDAPWTEVVQLKREGVFVAIYNNEEDDK